MRTTDLKKHIASFAILLIISSCGLVVKSGMESESSKSHSTSLDTNIDMENDPNSNLTLSDKTKKVPGFFLVSSSGTSSLSRVDAQIQGCASGYTHSFNSELGDESSFSLYKGDRNCIAVIDSLILNDETFTLLSGEFDSSVGATNVFTSTTNIKKLYVELLSQIPAVVSDDGFTLQIQIIELEESDEVSIELDKDVFSLDSETINIVENDSTTHTFTLSRLISSSAEAITVQLSLSGTAVQGSDYRISGASFNESTHTFDFAYDETEKTFQVTVINNSSDDDTRTLIIEIDNSSTGYLSYGKLEFNIQDDDDNSNIFGSVFFADANSTMTKAAHKTHYHISHWVSQTDDASKLIQTDIKLNPNYKTDKFKGSTPSLEFDGKKKYMTLNNSSYIYSDNPIEERSFFLVFEPKKVGKKEEFQFIYKEGGSSGGISIFLDKYVLYLCVFNNSPWNQICTSVSVAKDKEYTAYFNFSTSSDQLKILLNNGTSSSASGLEPIYQNSSDLIQVGGISTSTYDQDGSRMTKYDSAGFKGNLAALAVFNRSLETSEINTIFNYFDDMYGID